MYPRQRLQRLAAAGGVEGDATEGAGADIDLDSDEPGRDQPDGHGPETPS